MNKAPRKAGSENSKTLKRTFPSLLVDSLRALIATCRICWFRKSNRNLPMMVVQFQAFQVIVSGTHGNKASKRQFENYYSPPPLFLYDLTFIGL
jgi:hypothetical protein